MVDGAESGMRLWMFALAVCFLAGCERRTLPVERSIVSLQIVAQSDPLNTVEFGRAILALQTEVQMGRHEMSQGQLRRARELIKEAETFEMIRHQSAYVHSGSPMMALRPEFKAAQKRLIESCTATLATFK